MSKGDGFFFLGIDLEVDTDTDDIFVFDFRGEAVSRMGGVWIL